MSVKSLTQKEYIEQLVDYHKKFVKSITLKEGKKSSKKAQKKKEQEPVIIGENFFLTDCKNNAFIQRTISLAKNETNDKKLYIPLNYDIDAQIKYMNNWHTQLNKNITEDLSIDPNSVSGETIQDLKAIKYIIDVLNKMKMRIIEKNLIAKNELIETELKILKQDRSLYRKMDTDKSGSIENYLKEHTKLMTAKDKSGNPVLTKGTRMNYDGQEVILIDFLQGVGLLVERVDGDGDGEIILQRNQLKLIEGIRNRIRDLKIQSNKADLGDIIKALSKNERAIKLLLDHLLYQYSQDDIMSRPRLEIATQEGLKLPKRQYIYDELDFYSYVGLDALFNPNTKDIYINQKDICNKELLVSDKSVPILIDDFTFESIQSYHKASQFYNRPDLTPELRSEYNDFFIKFTKEYEGPDSMYGLSMRELNDILAYSPFKKSWEYNIGKPSISSIYLRKAIYHKMVQNPKLKECLLATGSGRLLERIGLFKYRVNYELMEVRYYLENNKRPPYVDYNYSKSVKADFLAREKDDQTKGDRILMEVFLELDSFSKRAQNLESVNPIEDIVLLYKQKEPIEPVNIDKINQYLYSYLADYIYGLMKINRNVRIDTILKQNPDLYGDLGLVSFMYIFVKLESRLKENQAIKEERDKVSQEKLAKETGDRKKEEAKELINSRIRLIKYLPNTWLEGRSDSLYLSIVNNLAVQNKYPMNFSNSLDTRPKFPKEVEMLGSRKIYNEAGKALLDGIIRLFLLWKPDDQQTADEIMNGTGNHRQLELELISRYLGADLSIIDKNKIVEISYLEIRNKIPVVLPEMTDYLDTHIHIVLGLIYEGDASNDYDIFIDAIANPSKKDKQIEYLLDRDSGVLLKELEDGQQEFVGIWDPIELTIDYETEMSDLGDKELEMDTMSFYTLDERMFNELTEIV